MEKNNLEDDQIEHSLDEVFVNDIKKEVVENNSDNVGNKDIDSMRIKAPVESDIDISFIKKEVDPHTGLLNVENNNYEEGVHQSLVDNADTNIKGELYYPVCFKTSKTWPRSKIHERTDIVTKILLRCNRCGFVCDHIHTLSQHIGVKHCMLDRVKCNNCGEIFCRDRNFTDGADNTDISCQSCQLKAKDETRNRSNDGLTNSNRMLLCERCGFMDTLQMCLNDHMEMHHSTSS